MIATSLTPTDNTAAEPDTSKSGDRRRVTKRGDVQQQSSIPSPKKGTTDMPQSKTKKLRSFLLGKNETYVSNSPTTRQPEQTSNTLEHTPIASSQSRTLNMGVYIDPALPHTVPKNPDAVNGPPYVPHTATPATASLRRKDLPQPPEPSVEQPYSRQLRTPERKASPEAMHQDTPQSLESITAQADAPFTNTNGTPLQSIHADITSDDKDVLWQVKNTWKVLEDFFADYPDMQGSNGESLDNAVDHITLQLGSIWSASKKKDEDLEKATSRISLLEKEFEKKQVEWRRKQTEAQSSESRVKILEKDLKEARANINRNYDVFKKDRKSLEQKIQKLESENRSLQSKDSDKKRLKESYEKLLREAKDAAAAEKRRASQQQESHRTNYNNHVKSMNERIALLERQNKELKDDLYDAGLKTGKIVRDLKAKLSKAELDAEKEKRELQEQLKAQEARLNKQHQANTQQLRSVNEEFRSALVAREHFKGLRDRDITKKFTGLATEIEDISTLGWNTNNSVDWPFSENQMRQIHPSNIRLLKQQIVQSCIWMLLHKHVFGSPFRIMGKEGQQADGIWRNIYGTDDSFQWPDVSADLEKARYETAQLFLAAIERTSGLSLDDQRLKNSFEDAVANALSDLYRALGKVTFLDERDEKILGGIVRLSAKIWLECCSQRYRLLAVVPDFVDDLLTSPQRELGSLTLLIKPDIKRFGTSQGDDIATGEVVAGLEGLFECYPVR